MQFVRLVLLFIIKVGYTILYFIELLTNFSIVIPTKIDLRKYNNVLISISSSILCLYVFILLYLYKHQVLQQSFEGLFLTSTNFLPSQFIPQKVLPEFKNISDKPYISAKSGFVFDRKYQKVLYEKNIDEKYPMASTTKLMTAIIAMEIYSLDDDVVVKKECTEVNGTKIGLASGRTYKVKDLLYSMLVYSAGDSACSLASYKIPWSSFIKRMNERANLLGMVSTNFENSIGLDESNGGQVSTARDLYRMANFAIQNPEIAQAVNTKEYVFYDQRREVSHFATTTNRLLFEIPEAVGVKTGTTLGAGEVLIFQFKKSNQLDLMIVVMGSTDRFEDTKSLLNWVLTNYSWEK